MSEQEFWALTPLELDVLTKAHRRKRRLEALPLAVLIQITANVNRDSQQRLQPYEIWEVMQWLGFPEEPEERPPPPAPPTPEELRTKLAMLQQMFPPSNGQTLDG